MQDLTKPTVSVIVPVYKVEQFLPNCLDHLKQQSFNNWEAILVDDGSPDRSGRICDEYAQSDARFRVIHKENGGLSSARNAALPIAQGEFIFFLDSDDFLHPDALGDLVSLARHHNADIVQGGFVRGAEREFPAFNSEAIVSVYDNHSVFLKYAAKIITCGKLYSREVLGDIRFPEGLINEDDFTTWKYYYRARKIVVTSRPYYYYTVNPNSTMANQQRKPNLNYFNAYRERIEFFRNRNEQDLEAISRVQWMKSLVMLYSNRQISADTRKDIKRLFAENFKSKSLKAVTIPTKLAVVFRAFNIAPEMTSKIIKKLYKAGV